MPNPEEKIAADTAPPTRKPFSVSIRWIAALAILGWLFYQHRDALKSLSGVNLSAFWLASALILRTTSISTSCVRWYFLVKALGLPISMRDSFRLGFLAIAASHVTPGSAGGEVVRVIAALRKFPEARVAGIASIVLDRTLGFLTYLGMAGASAFLIAGQDSPRWLTDAAWWLLLGTIAVSVLLIALLTPGFSQWRPIGWMLNVRGFRSILVPLSATAGIWTRHRQTVLLGVLFSVIGHLAIIGAFAACLAALPNRIASPSFTVLTFALPVTEIAGALVPLPAGIGFREGALPWLLSTLASEDQRTATLEHAFVATLLFRTVTASIAGIVGFAALVSRNSTRGNHRNHSAS